MRVARPPVPARRHRRHRHRRHRRDHPLDRGARRATAVEEADLVLFVVDARAGITPGDEEVAEILRASHKPVLVLANKIDDPSRDSHALEFHRLGLGDPVPLSAMHGHGTGDLLDEVVDRLEAARRGTAGAARGRDPRRDPRPPERRQVVAAERAARPRARDRLGESRARRATRSTRCSSATAARSCSSTRPACGASASTGRGSSTTRSCARSRRPSAPTSRSCWSTRAKASSSRT